MWKFFLIFLILSNGFIFAQKINNLSDNETVNSKMETVAVFPKGTKVFRKMIKDNFRMRKINITENIFCEITFIVEKDGKMSNIKASGNDEKFNEEAVRSVTKIKEKWIPARINGQKVRYRFRVPLNITY